MFHLVFITIYIPIYLLCLCSIGPKKLKRVKKKWIHRKETLKTWISRKKIVVAFILGDYSGLLKSLFNSILPRVFFFFFLSLSNVFFLYHSFYLCSSASIRRKGSPSSSWRWRRQCYHRSVDTYHISQIAMTGWVMTWIRQHTPLLKPVWKPVLNSQNLATWFSCIAIWWINLKVPESSMLTSGTVVQHMKVQAWLYKNYTWTLQVTWPARVRFVTFLIIRLLYLMTDDSWCARMFFNLETTTI